MVRNESGTKKWIKEAARRIKGLGENFGAYKQRLRMFTVHCSEMAEPVKLMHLGYTFQMHFVQ